MSDCLLDIKKMKKCCVNHCTATNIYGLYKRLLECVSANLYAEYKKSDVYARSLLLENTYESVTFTDFDDLLSNNLGVVSIKVQEDLSGGDFYLLVDVIVSDTVLKLTFSELALCIRSCYEHYEHISSENNLKLHMGLLDVSTYASLYNVSWYSVMVINCDYTKKYECLSSIKDYLYVNLEDYLNYKFKGLCGQVIFCDATYEMPIVFARLVLAFSSALALHMHVRYAYRVKDSFDDLLDKMKFYTDSNRLTLIFSYGEPAEDEVVEYIEDKKTEFAECNIAFYSFLMIGVD